MQTEPLSRRQFKQLLVWLIEMPYWDRPSQSHGNNVPAFPEWSSDNNCTNHLFKDLAIPPNAGFRSRIPFVAGRDSQVYSCVWGLPVFLCLVNSIHSVSPQIYLLCSQLYFHIYFSEKKNLQQITYLNWEERKKINIIYCTTSFQRWVSKGLLSLLLYSDNK